MSRNKSEKKRIRGERRWRGGREGGRVGEKERGREVRMLCLVELHCSSLTLTYAIAQTFFQYIPLFLRLYYLNLLLATKRMVNKT